METLLMPTVNSLGHIGLYVDDLDAMTTFYTAFLGLTVTDRSDWIVFLSAQPESEHHELVLIGRESADEGRGSAVQQMSYPVDSWEDLQEFHRQIVDRGYTIDRILNHGIAIGCYFRDPENNPIEIYWPTGRDYPQPCGQSIDMTLSSEQVSELVRELTPPETPDQPRYYGDAVKRH
jgi:catechol-2,3-dioxygenase